MATYILVSLWHPHKYIGMSTISTPAREASRDRKYHQLQRGSFAKYELALVWWHHSKTFYDFTAITITNPANKLATQVNESSAIYPLKPNLNHPYINHIIQPSYIHPFTILPSSIHQCIHPFIYSFIIRPIIRPSLILH